MHFLIRYGYIDSESSYIDSYIDIESNPISKLFIWTLNL